MNIELKTWGTPKQVVKRLKEITDAIEDAIDSDENTDIILDGVDEELWDIEDSELRISC